MQTQDINIESKRQLRIGADVRTNHVVPVAGVEYKQGDLIVIDQNNLGTLAKDAITWNAVCLRDITAEQVQMHLDEGKMIPVYTAGTLSLAALMVKGQYLDTNQRMQAKATANRGLAINLQLPHGAESGEMVIPTVTLASNDVNSTNITFSVPAGTMEGYTITFDFIVRGTETTAILTQNADGSWTSNNKTHVQDLETSSVEGVVTGADTNTVVSATVATPDRNIGETTTITTVAVIPQ